MREFNTTLPVRWAPYIYWRRHPSFHGRYITIDRLGRRVTPQPKGPNAPSARVHFFGGSTMWDGFSGTIIPLLLRPSVGFKRLRVLASASYFRTLPKTAFC